MFCILLFLYKVIWNFYLSKKKKKKKSVGISVKINLFYRRHKYCGVRFHIFEGDIDIYNNKIGFGY